MSLDLSGEEAVARAAAQRHNRRSPAAAKASTRTAAKHHLTAAPTSSGQGVGFAVDSPLEEAGFELSVPLIRISGDFWTRV
jgi:hypothetical protein